ncbi:MAG TPA: tetratricopeptide repeat protein [Geobacteraceae bacterium]|nr:tetratricopeptide repeat protein [Geobacteraceae bacterium]
MPNTQAAEIYEKGLQALSNGHEYLALVCFEQAANMEKTPLHCSYLAFCLAKARGQYREATTLCAEALGNDPANSVHYVNLGRIYILAGQREKALETLREGLQYQRTDEILRELEILGMRGRPVFSYLKRENPLNKYCGLLLKKLGYR